MVGFGKQGSLEWWLASSNGRRHQQLGTSFRVQAIVKSSWAECGSVWSGEGKVIVGSDTWCRWEWGGGWDRSERAQIRKLFTNTYREKVRFNP